MRAILLRLICHLALGLMLLGISSCSKAPSDNSTTPIMVKDPVNTPPVRETPKPEIPADFEEDIKIGRYKVEFSPLNEEFAGITRGSGTLNVTSTDFSVELNIEGAPSNTIHSQYIHLGTECPGKELDKNGDGIIDFNEASDLVGQIVIPLDGDLHSQRLDSYLFPVADFDGLYIYSQTAAVKSMIEDLRRPDENIEDSIVKLGAKGKLDPEGKVILIYGVSAEVEIPESVSVFNSFSAKASVPIACGKILKTNGAF